VLFLALPPADMLPPAGHRAGPGCSLGPHRPLRTARRASSALLSSRCSRRRGQGCPTKSLKLLLRLPRPAPEQPAPRRGPRTRRPGWHRPGKSVREKSRPGVNVARRPGPQAGPQEGSLHHPCA
jgi:hypothetical protein